MALDKATLTATLTTIFSDTSGKTAAQQAAAVADAIDTFVKSGTVSFAAGTITGDDSNGDTHDDLTATGGTIA